MDVALTCAGICGDFKDTLLRVVPVPVSFYVPPKHGWVSLIVPRVEMHVRRAVPVHRTF